VNDALTSRDGGEAPVTPEDIEAGTVLAVGVSSAVLREAGEDGEGDLEAVGHVLLLDYDDGATYADVRAEAGRFDGVTAVLESSEGSFHVWNLSVRDLDTALLDALRTGTDALHVQQSAKRGRFILRCGPKFRLDPDDGSLGETYKGAPEVVDAWATPTAAPTSRPHLDLLRALAEEQGVDLDLDLDALDGDLVGSKVFRSEYLTMDDATKRRGL
jgi:hypothetical protein